jgi:predicted porin
MEAGINADTGTSGQGGILFGRQIYAGLKSATYGSVTLGRQYSPEYNVTVFADPFGSGFTGDSKNILEAPPDTSSRVNNSVKYASPVISGFRGELLYGAGEMAGTARGGRQLGASLAYAAGPFEAQIGYHNRNNDKVTTQTSPTRNTILAATYNLVVAKLYLAYAINQGFMSSPLRNTGNPYGYAVAPTNGSVSQDSTDVLAGVSVPYGRHTFLVSYIRKNDNTALNQDATQYAIGYLYSLSKRTNLYSSYGLISNKNGASYTVGNATDGGSGNRALAVGFRHTF